MVDVATRKADGGHRRPRRRLRRAGLDAGRSDDRRPRQPSAGQRRLAERHLAARRGRLRCGTDRRPQPVGPTRPDARLGHEQRRDAGRDRRGSCPSADGRSITFTAPIDGAYELWRIDTADGDRHPSDARPPLHLELRRGARCAGPRPDRLPALRPHRDLRPLAARWGRGAAPPDRVQRGRPRRADPDRAGRAPFDRRRPRHPGLVPAGRGTVAAAGHRDPRRSAHALWLVASSGSSRSSPRTA